MIGTEVDNLSSISRNFLDVATHVGHILAQTGDDESWAFLGEDSLAWLVLAFGAAMVVGNVLALVRPPAGVSDEAPRSAPFGRSMAMIIIGAIASLWGIASLLG